MRVWEEVLSVHCLKNDSGRKPQYKKQSVHKEQSVQKEQGVEVSEGQGCLLTVSARLCSSKLRFSEKKRSFDLLQKQVGH